MAVSDLTLRQGQRKLCHSQGFVVSAYLCNACVGIAHSEHDANNL